jgi:3-hydroxy-9,10-secoandrosta-1,3,5(10)-triene-9,17-dione monooxygenase reductase component
VTRAHDCPAPVAVIDRGVSMSPDELSFRTVLSHFATGVTVITALDGDDPIGVSVNSFTSVSLDPPLVLFCIGRNSNTWPRIKAAGHFTVNILNEDQEDVSRVFATKGADRFRRTGWRPGTNGSPILDDCLAYIDCTINAEQQAGDHVIVVGQVRELEVLSPDSPLIFWRGGYSRLAS